MTNRRRVRGVQVAGVRLLVESISSSMARRRAATALSALLLAAVAAVGMACTYDWTYIEDAGAGDAGDSGPPIPPKDASGDTNPPKEPPPPSPVECKDSNACSPTQLCQFPDGQCARNGGVVSGFCVEIAEICGKPVPGGSPCGCDGVTYSDTCDAAKTGRIDVDTKATSCVGAGLFACPKTAGCKRKSEYCYVKVSSGFGSCMPYTTCQTASCACADLPSAGCTCVDTKDPPDAVTTSCN